MEKSKEARGEQRDYCDKYQPDYQQPSVEKGSGEPRVQVTETDRANDRTDQSAAAPERNP